MSRTDAFINLTNEELQIANSGGFSDAKMDWIVSLIRSADPREEVVVVSKSGVVITASERLDIIFNGPNYIPSIGPAPYERYRRKGNILDTLLRSLDDYNARPTINQDSFHELILVLSIVRYMRSGTFHSCVLGLDDEFDINAILFTKRHDGSNKEFSL